MEEMQTFAQIRELFQDEDLRKRLMKAESRSDEEVLGLLVTAGAQKDVDFSADSLRRLIEVFGSPERKPPTDKELGEVPTDMMAGTHNHMSCCSDCPHTGSLCC